MLLLAIKAISHKDRSFTTGLDYLGNVMNARQLDIQG